MGTERIIEETATKLVLEMVDPILEDDRKEWRKVLINPLLFLVVSYIIVYVALSLTWLYWAIAIGVLLIEAFFLFLLLGSARKRMVTIDLYSRRATRIEELRIGFKKKQELALEEVSRIVYQCDESKHHDLPECRVQLESPNHPPLIVTNNPSLMVTGDNENPHQVFSMGSRSLLPLARKLGKFIKKPVVSRSIDKGTILSEQTIQT